MGHHVVKISQLNSESGRVFLYVDDTYDSLSVCGSVYKSQAYLLENHFTFKVIQFGTRDEAAEWLRQNRKYYKKITRIGVEK